jgi:hypothetical protein
MAARTELARLDGCSDRADQRDDEQAEQGGDPAPAILEKARQQHAPAYWERPRADNQSMGGRPLKFCETKSANFQQIRRELSAIGS